MPDPTYPPVRWYTLARRFPQLIARTHDGTAIPGGPYTVTAFCTAGALAFVLVKTFAMWSPLVGNPVVACAALLAAVYATAWGVTRLPLEGRSPLSMALGLMNLAGAPREGRVPCRRLARRAPRPGRGHRPSHALVQPVPVEEVDHA